MSNVQFKNVGKSYSEKAWAVRNFNLKIAAGEFVSFLGPSGCGKTTSLRMLAGLEKNTSGEISFDSDIVSNAESGFFLAPEKRKVGMVFQSYAVWPHMNVYKNIAYPLVLQKKSKTEIAASVKETMELVELDGLGERMPNQLSGGQQQRVALARGLIMNPRILLLDEPLSNLDAKLRQKMRKDIRQIQQLKKLTLVYVTHDQDEAFQMSDRIVIMNSGQIEQIGSPKEIQDSPGNAFVADFISEASVSPT